MNLPRFYVFRQVKTIIFVLLLKKENFKNLEDDPQI